MPKIASFLWFDGQAEDAAKHYVSIFPNSKITQTTHYGERMPKPKGTVMTVAFELDGRPFVALNGGPEFKFNEAVSFAVDCKNQGEIDHYWSKLAAGGEEGPCGWLKDKFGLSWQIVPAELPELLSDAHPARSQAVMDEVMKMKKLDLATMKKAYASK